MPERQVNNMNKIENLVDLDKLNELKISELKKLNKLLGKDYLEDFEDDFEDEADDVEEDDDAFFEDEGEN